jgi:hypothetical protein
MIVTRIFRFIRLLFLVSIMFTLLVLPCTGSSEVTLNIGLGTPQDAIAEKDQYPAEETIVGAWYLSFPLRGQASTSATINSVFDHSMTKPDTDDDEGRKNIWPPQKGLGNALWLYERGQTGFQS